MWERKSLGSFPSGLGFPAVLWLSLTKGETFFLRPVACPVYLLVPQAWVLVAVPVLPSLLGRGTPSLLLAWRSWLFMFFLFPVHLGILSLLAQGQQLQDWTTCPRHFL